MAKELSFYEYNNMWNRELERRKKDYINSVYIIEYLKDNPGSRIKDIAEYINSKEEHKWYDGWHIQYYTKLIQKLIIMGYVKRDKIKSGKINEIMLCLPKEIIVDGEKFYSEKCKNQLKKFEEKIAVFSLVE